MADAAADSETPWRGLPSVALGQSATGRRGPGAKETAMRDYYTTLRDFLRSYAISRDLSRRYARCLPPLKVYNTPSSGLYIADLR